MEPRNVINTDLEIVVKAARSAADTILVKSHGDAIAALTGDIENRIAAIARDFASTALNDFASNVAGLVSARQGEIERLDELTRLVQEEAIEKDGGVK